MVPRKPGRYAKSRVMRLRNVRAWFKGMRGEQHVASILEPLEDEGFYATHDLQRRRGGNAWNVDHVVAGPTGVFVLETKAWTGNVYMGKGGAVMCSGVDKSRELSRVTGDAMDTKRHLANAGIDVRVHTVVVLTAAKLRKPLRFGRTDIIEAKDLPAYLRAGRGALTPRDVVRARAAILRGDAVVRVTPISNEGPESATG